MQDAPRKPGGDTPEDATNGSPQEGNTLNNLNFISVGQQNAVVITRKGMKRDQREADKPAPERWL